MTNKEAIQVLNMIEAHGSLVIKAKEMAIKALEQEPKARTARCNGCRFYKECKRKAEGREA